MRQLLVIVSLFLSSLFASSFTINNKVLNALEKMQSGHIEQAVEDLKKASATNDVLAQF